MKWKNKFDIKDILSADIKISTVTGGYGGCSPFNASIWDERYVQVWLKGQTYPETIWGQEGEKFMEWYNKNK